MFRIHRSERADALADALVRIIADPPDDPFTPEIVAIPTRGVERWLTHRIAQTVGASEDRRDGICAHVEFPFPSRLIGDVLAGATGVNPAQDPWRPERLVWPVLATIDAHLDEPWLSVIANHLGAGAPKAGDDGDNQDLRQRRRFSTARRIAELFDRYSTYRPDLILRWHTMSGEDPTLASDAQWQPELWRRVHLAVGAPSPPERIRTACTAIGSGEIDIPVPARLSLFGLTRLPATHLEVLQAIGHVRDVHLFALHPSLALWDKIVATGVPALPLARREDPTRNVPDNPLLRTWANDSREMQLVLSAAADAHSEHHALATGEPSTLLERLQHAVRTDTAPPGPPTPGHDDRRSLHEPTDRSVQVHACHGPDRQVEVVRDAICHALADDPTLEPRDIIVMCPDIDAFAPLFHATFGSTSGDGTRATGAQTVDERGLPALPYRLADRSLRQANPLLAALDSLLELIDGRVSAPELIGFAGREPVRRRFGFDDDDIERISEWITQANIRWGLSPEHRERYQLGTVDANTWQAGIDRLMLGITMTTDGSRIIGERLPVDDIESGDIDLAGRLAELVARVDHIATGAAQVKPIAEWADLLRHAAELLLDTAPADAWQRVQVDAVVREVATEATAEETTSSSPLSLSEVQALMADRLKGFPTRTDFRTGAITMCTMHPMRAVPHRVVCIVGLDDGAFPRVRAVDGDDLLSTDPQVGDQDARHEDRQLLLDAVLAATERLIITHTGHDPRTNEVRAPAVPLSELLDVCDSTERTADGRPVSSAITTRHPLQPFDPATHIVGDPATNGEPWSFDRIGLAGANALLSRRRAAPTFAGHRLDPPAIAGGTIELDTLIRFVQHPMREFLRQRLGVNTWEDDGQLADAMPVETNALEAWAIGDRMLAHLMAGDSLDAVIAAELGSGSLPPQEMGMATIRSIAATAEAIATLAARHAEPAALGSREIDIDLGTVDDAGSVRVVGTVAGVAEQVRLRASYSSIGARHRLDSWLSLLALTASYPDVAWEAIWVGRKGDDARIVRHGPLGDHADDRRTLANQLLADLVRLWRSGMCEPLPLPLKTAEAWATAQRRGDDAVERTRWKWESRRFPGEDVDAVHQRILGAAVPLDVLLDIKPTESETGDGWAEDEASRFGRLARRLWDPILAAESWR